ncbi:MAG TPA: DUF192 domain-containing protein, partial [Streptosporangiaceae bacterium]
MLAGCGGSGRPPAVKLAGHRIVVDVASSTSEQEKGLSGRRSLARGHGMLFPQKAPALVRIWMRGMRFPLDVLWLRRGRVVAVRRLGRPRAGHAIPQAEPAKLADAVLELPAGTVRRLRVHRGTRVADGGLAALRRRLDVFGLHGASLELRLHATTLRDDPVRTAAV